MTYEYCSVDPLDDDFMASLKIAHFSILWSNLKALYLYTMHLSLIWSLLWSMESRHRAKADVCFSKQQTLSEDGDGIPCVQEEKGSSTNWVKADIFTQ